MNNIKRFFGVLLITASLLTGCNYKTNNNCRLDDNKEDKNLYSNNSIEVSEKYGKGCAIFQEGDSFEQNGMTITVNYSKITKKHGEWDNYIDFFPKEDDEGIIEDDSCYLVVNMNVFVNDRKNYPLGFCGLYSSVIDKETGERIDGSGIVSSTYYNNMDDDVKNSDGLFIDFPKENEKIVNQDFIFYIENEMNVNENVVYCLEVEDYSRTIASNQGKEYVSLVVLQPTIDL